MHDRIGAALEEQYEDHSEDIAVRLARHFQEAKIPTKAIDYLALAGNRAVRLSANEEAITHFSKALALIEILPQTQERDLRELNLLNSISVALMMARGYASPELGQACDRALLIIQKTEEKPELFPMIWHLGSYYGMRADYSTSLTLTRQLFQYAEHYDDPLQTLLANWGLSFVLLRMGELEKGLFHLEEVINAYDLEQHRELAYIYATDPLVACLSWSSWALWMLGNPVQAKQRSQEAISHALSLSHLGSQIFAPGVAAYLHLFNREFETALELIEVCTALAIEHKLPFWLATLSLLRGWALIEQGQIEDGLAEMGKGLQDFRMVGTRDLLSLYLSQMAMANAQAGMVDEGFDKLKDAETFIQETGERFYEAEQLRIKGEMLLMQSQENQEQAEQCFRKAKQTAIQQGAKSWELRAALSLGHLLHKQDRQPEARKQLEDVYGWFTEGFETPDLKESQRLLEELN